MTLKQIRYESGLKVRKIADVLGISQKQYYNLENGAFKFDKLKIEKLSELYEKPVEVIEQSIIEGVKMHVKE